jgi:hypothetical protein
MKPPQRSVFLRKQIPQARYTKRINPQCLFYYQKRVHLLSRIRSWSVLSQRPEWRPAQSYTCRNGAHTTPTSLRTDSSTAFGILKETIKQKHSKEMDMRYHWLTDRVCQKQFDVYWRQGRENLGDYHTKHHSAQHHKDMRGLILYQANSLQVMRGCVKLLPLPQPSLRACTDARTNPSAQRPTQLRSVLARVYAVSRQNQITTAFP